MGRPAACSARPSRDAAAGNTATRADRRGSHEPDPFVDRPAQSLPNQPKYRGRAGRRRDVEVDLRSAAVRPPLGHAHRSLHGENARPRRTPRLGLLVDTPRPCARPRNPVLQAGPFVPRAPSQIRTPPSSLQEGRTPGRATTSRSTPCRRGRTARSTQPTMSSTSRPSSCMNSATTRTTDTVTGAPTRHSWIEGTQGSGGEHPTTGSGTDAWRPPRARASAGQERGRSGDSKSSISAFQTIGSRLK